MTDPPPPPPAADAARPAAGDADLAARLAAGDAAALQEVIDRWAGPVGRTVARLVPDGAAEDCVQETFVKVWRNAGEFRGESALSTWVFQVALNVARDAGRKRRVRSAADRAAAASLHRPPHAPAAGSVCEAADGQDRVRRAVAALPAELREPLALRHFGGRTVPETAAALGLPQGTVKDRCARALAALRPALARAGLDPRDDR